MAESDSERQKTQQRAAVDVLQSIERDLAELVQRKRRPKWMEGIVCGVWELYVLLAVATSGLFFMYLGTEPISAIQQAAGGAMASTILISGYTLARAIDRIILRD